MKKKAAPQRQASAKEGKKATKTVRPLSDDELNNVAGGVIAPMFKGMPSPLVSRMNMLKTRRMM